MRKTLLAFLAAVLCLAAGAAELVLYAAPEAIGSGNGSSAANAARVWDAQLWKNIQKKLADTPVTLQLLPGKYYTQYPAKPDTRLQLTSIGNEKNRFTLRGMPDNATQFSRHPEDAKLNLTDPQKLLYLIALRKNCRNIVIENLYFTGDAPYRYALQISQCQDITIRNCEWKDLRGALRGATGASNNCQNITWENCRFENVGYDGLAHMIYNNTGCQNLTIRNCTMIDAFGDFVRFRDRIDNVLVENCKFISNGKYVSSPMIAFPVFVTQAKVKQGGEFFATGLTIRNCSFEFKKAGKRNWMMAFHISGYNPPGREYMISKKDIAAFNALDRNARRKFLDDRMALQTNRLIFENNTVINAADAVVYECWPNYGSAKEFPNAEYKNVLSLSSTLIDSK